LAVKEAIVEEGRIRRILLPMLGSPWSEWAFGYAVRLAQVHALELVMVAVVTPTCKPGKWAVWDLGLTANGQDSDVMPLVHALLRCL
jgi:hypothetical protein